MAKRSFYSRFGSRIKTLKNALARLLHSNLINNVTIIIRSTFTSYNHQLLKLKAGWDLNPHQPMKHKLLA